MTSEEVYPVFLLEMPPHHGSLGKLLFFLQIHKQSELLLSLCFQSKCNIPLIQLLRLFYNYLCIYLLHTVELLEVQEISLDHLCILGVHHCAWHTTGVQRMFAE